jgi:hypothetical protein
MFTGNALLIKGLKMLAKNAKILFLLCILGRFVITVNFNYKYLWLKEKS